MLAAGTGLKLSDILGVYFFLILTGFGQAIKR